MHSRRRLPPATDNTPGERHDFIEVCHGSTVVVHVVVQCRGSNVVVHVMVQCRGSNVVVQMLWFKCCGSVSWLKSIKIAK